jgi:hypothetical protein
MHSVARVSIKYQNTPVRDKYQCVFYCALSTLHVSALISGHPQVIFPHKIYLKAGTNTYIKGSVKSDI